MKGSEIIVNALKKEHVDVVFGYPGSSVLELYDALFAHKEIRHILTANEQGAAHAADGYARRSKKVGVCVATSGPGATNLVTGIANAYMDSIPMVAITGNVSSSKLGKDSFQEVDIAGITMPVTKHNFIVRSAAELPIIMHRAFSIAGSGRKGPVLVDVTTDALCEDFPIEDFDALYDSFSEEHSFDRFTANDVKEALKLIKKARKPLLYIGGGAVMSGAGEEIKELAEDLDAFVCDSLMGKGCFDGLSKRYLGMLGVHGTKTAHDAVGDCDLLIAVGVRFSDRSTENFRNISQNARIIHIDIDPAEINKNIQCDVSLVGDATSALKALLKGIKDKRTSSWNIGAKAEPAALSDSELLTDDHIIRTLFELTGDDKTVIVTEVGSHQMNAVNIYSFTTPSTLITSGGLGTMGFGLPAAIGAVIADPSAKVINLAGDGSFRMNMAELATAVRYNIPLVQVVFDNHSLGLVRSLQDELCNGRHAYTDIEDKTDFALLAKAMGAEGIRVTERNEVAEAFKKAFEITSEKHVPVVIECETYKADLV